MDTPYAEALDFLYQQLPMFSRLGAQAFKKDLSNTLALCKALGNPERRFKSIHVAGTNGKGSVSHMLAAVFQQAGYSTGLYTSPHLLDFRERIRINGKMVEESFITDFVDRVKPLVKKISPSFFEMTVAMAFDYFAKKGVDIAVIEVGLGGRLDSTNVIVPELSVITNISYDHQQLLGNTLPEIAAEKAGIIKEHIPVVIGETDAETAGVFLERAKAKQSAISFADQEAKTLHATWTLNHLEITVSEPAGEARYWLDLNGQYQGKNLLTVLSAVRALRQKGWQLPEEAVKEALQHVKRLTGLRGRWDILLENPLIILDVAHNEAGIRQVMTQVKSLTFRKLHIVTGFVKDKDVNKLLELFPPGADYYFCKADIPRAMDEHELAILGIRKGLHGNGYPSVTLALKEALRGADTGDLVLICGSCFIVGEAIPSLSSLILEKQKRDN